jgi:hypothetical protein
MPRRSAGAGSSSSLPPLDEAEGDDKGGVFEVESLLGKRKKNGVDQVKVQWVGYRQRAWEPRENVIDGELLAEFDAAEARAAEAKKQNRGKGTHLGGGMWLCSHIGAERGHGSGRQFLIWWANYKQPTWQAASEITDLVLRQKWEKRGEVMEISGRGYVDGVEGYWVKYTHQKSKCWLEVAPPELLEAWAAAAASAEKQRLRSDKAKHEAAEVAYKAGETRTWYGREPRDDELAVSDTTVLQYMPCFQKIQDQIFRSLGSTVSMLS